MRQLNLAELWQWALDEGYDSRGNVPDRLHTRAFPPGTDPDKGSPKDLTGVGPKGSRLSQRRDQIIGGPPYTKRFAQHLQRAMMIHRDSAPRAPIHRALQKMRAPGRGVDQSLEYRVVWAIVEGHYPDVGILSWSLHLKEDLVRRAAVRGLGLLWDLVQRELADEADSTRRIERAHPGGIHA